MNEPKGEEGLWFLLSCPRFVCLLFLSRFPPAAPPSLLFLEEGDIVAAAGASPPAPLAAPLAAAADWVGGVAAAEEGVANRSSGPRSDSQSKEM